MKKRLLAVLMCFCITLSMIPGMVFASERIYVALGDSITTGYGLSDASTESFPALVAEENTLALTNLAEDGATSADLLKVVQNNTAILSNADVITITIGGNDLMDALYLYLTNTYNESKEDDEKLTVDEVKAKLLAMDTDLISAVALDFATFTESQEASDAITTLSRVCF